MYFNVARIEKENDTNFYVLKANVGPELKVSEGDLKAFGEKFGVRMKK